MEMGQRWSLAALWVSTRSSAGCQRVESTLASRFRGGFLYFGGYFGGLLSHRAHMSEPCGDGRGDTEDRGAEAERRPARVERRAHLSFAKTALRADDEGGALRLTL